MKAIPIEYIQEFIEAWDDCKDDPEVRGGEVFKNKLYCSARRNALINLIKYWEEDKEEWEVPSKEKTINDPEVQEVLKMLNDVEEV